MTYGPNLGMIINAATGDAYPSDLRFLLRTLDVLLQPAVISKSLSAPPGSPANGDRYIVAASPTGGWSSFTAGDFVVWTTDDPGNPSGYWADRTPKKGWLVYNIADTTFYYWSGTAWVAVAGGGSSTLAALTDVLLTSPANNDVLHYDSGTSKWKNFIPPWASAFLGLSDVPGSYSGAGGKAVEVNAGATALVFSAKPFDLSVFAPGVGTNSQILVRIKLARAVTFPASATLSQATASANATGSTTFTLKKNGTSFATVNYAASASSGTWTQASDAVFAAGDLLEIDGPATADATLKDVGITLAGIRS
jgi:Protein of unknown function (DUF2793)